MTDIDIASIRARSNAALGSGAKAVRDAYDDHIGRLDAISLMPSIAYNLAASALDVPALLDEVERLHSWDGLMSLLNEMYPDDIYPTREDDQSRDPGPRIVSLLRRLDEARGAIARVEALHRVDQHGHCVECSTNEYYDPSKPCRTVRALRGDG